MTVCVKVYYMDGNQPGKKVLIKDLELEDISIDFESNQISQSKMKEI